MDEPAETAYAADLATVRALTIARLANAGITNPEVDADLLIGHALGINRGEVQVKRVVGFELTTSEAKEIAGYVARRERREPLQHITGKAPFRSLELDVGPGVFIPRPESEQVTQLAIDALRATPVANPIVVDICAGSGAIAIAIATEVPNAKVWAVEKSAEAARWARHNIDRLTTGNLMLVIGDLADTLHELDGTCAVVISNPPYVPDGAIPREPEVYQYDPEQALYGGRDGLDVVRSLVRRAKMLLHPGGLLVIEHGEFQADQVSTILRVDGWRAVAKHRDFTMRDRATTAVR